VGVPALRKERKRGRLMLVPPLLVVVPPQRQGAKKGAGVGGLEAEGRFLAPRRAR
jgi:hypothetical protein